MRIATQLLRWIGWSMPTLAIAFIIGIPAFVFAIGATPDLSGNVAALLIAGAAASTYAIICIGCWLPFALWVPTTESSWRVLAPSFVFVVIVIGQFTALAFNSEDYSPLYCALGSAYSAAAVLLPRVLDKKLRPGCFSIKSRIEATS